MTPTSVPLRRTAPGKLIAAPGATGSGGRNGGFSSASKTLSIREQDVGALVRMWRELGEFPASEGRASLEHVLASLKRWIGVERIWWLAAVRRGPGDPERPWRDWKAVDTYYLDGNGEDRAYAERMLERYEADQPNLYHRRRLALSGTCHVARPSDVMKPVEWYGDWYYGEIRKPRGLDEIMVGTYSFDADTMVHVGVDRSVRGRPFGVRDRELLQLFLGGSHAWIREQLLSGGWIVRGARLSPREREVMSALLTDASEKEIAERLGLGVRTTHDYVTRIFRRLGVSGRAGLTALWLRYPR